MLYAVAASTRPCHDGKAGFLPPHPAWSFSPDTAWKGLGIGCLTQLLELPSHSDQKHAADFFPLNSLVLAGGSRRGKAHTHSAFRQPVEVVLDCFPHELCLSRRPTTGRRSSLPQLRITFRVAEPAAWARHLRFCSSANAVTGQGLGEVSAANEAGNPVLDDVGFYLRDLDNSSAS